MVTFPSEAHSLALSPAIDLGLQCSLLGLSAGNLLHNPCSCKLYGFLPSVFLGLCSLKWRGRRYIKQAVRSERSASQPCPLELPITSEYPLLSTQNWELRGWKQGGCDLFLLLKASLPLCVYALGCVKLWFRAWVLLLIPFIKFWAVHFADYSPDSQFLPGHIPAPGFFCVVSKYFKQTCYGKRFLT